VGAVDLGAVVDVQDVHSPGLFVNAVDDPVGAPACAVQPDNDPNSGLPTRCGLAASACSQNSSTAAATDSGGPWLTARRAAGWKRST
jgi:hypothetical protein